MRRALLVTGGPGTGKTAVVREALALAAERGLRAAAVDLDWLGWTAGLDVGVDELIGRNLAAIAAHDAAAGADRLLLARALAGPGALARLRAAVAGWDVSVIRLVAPRAVAESRLRARDSGHELAEHLAELDSMASAAAAAEPAAPVVVNGERPLREVALEVLRAAGWIDA